ncbi:MAG: hypothetical protein JO004_10845 [Methylobacteriaceae bacterium]|nr:hypothetical protein [Methylobacteriaceae bacterium]
MTMNPDDRASLLLGQALRRAMLDRGGPADRRELAWSTYAALCKHELSEQEAIEIRSVTGLIDLSGQWHPDARPW